jgi:hypothetical protein
VIFLIDNGVGRHKAITSIQKWAKAGSNPEDDPVQSSVPEKATGFLSSLTARFTPRSRPVKAEEEEKSKAKEESEAEEEEEVSDLEEGPFVPLTPPRTITETASVFSGETAGTRNPLATGVAKDAPKVTVRDVREAAGSGREVKRSTKGVDWSAFANEILDNLSYVGFNTILTRQKVKETMAFEDVVKALAIYTRIGNSAKRRLKKGVLKSDAAVTDATEFLRDNGIVPKVKGTDKLSLPRIAQSFAPILYVLRKGAVELLDKRVDSSTKLELQDVAFGGYYPDANDFHTKFGRILGKWEASQKKETYDEAATDLRNKGFQDLSARGLESDKYLKEGIDHVRDWDGARAWFENEGFGGM